MTHEELLKYWESIPCDDKVIKVINSSGELVFSKYTFLTYGDLQDKWNVNRRTCRAILAELSAFDSGDDYILIRSSHNGGGFFKTRNHALIELYRREVYNRAINTLKPLKKIKRVLNRNEQMTIDDLLLLGVTEKGG